MLVAFAFDLDAVVLKHPSPCGEGCGDNSACDTYATYTRDAYEIQKIFDKVEKITLFVKACGLP